MLHLFLTLCHRIYPIQLGITSNLIPLSLFLKLLLKLLKFPLEVLLNVPTGYPTPVPAGAPPQAPGVPLKHDLLRTSTQGVAPMRKMTTHYYYLLLFLYYFIFRADY